MPTIPSFLSSLYSLEGQVVVVTGGSGVLGSVMSRGLARAGGKVAVLGRTAERNNEVAAQIETEGGTAKGFVADVLDRTQLEAVRDEVLATWGRLDVLVNAAGGNMASATIEPGQTFFDRPVEGMEAVIALNLNGTLLPTQVFGEAMARAGRGSIINISSMSAQRALTRVLGYGVAKGAVENATRWLAVELARAFGSGLRVNAIAPGFFVGEQNRRLLTHEDGSLTARGQTIIDHTPAGRFGDAEEITSALVFLAGPGASFINGVVLNIDGGFMAYSGV